MSIEKFKVGDLVGLVEHVGVRMFVADVKDSTCRLTHFRTMCADHDPLNLCKCWTQAFLHSDLYPISVHEVDESLMKSFISIIRGRANLLIGRADYLVGSLYADVGCVKKSDHHTIFHILRGIVLSSDGVSFITANMPATAGYLCEILDCETADLIGIAENNNLTIYGLKES